MAASSPPAPLQCSQQATAYAKSRVRGNKAAPHSNTATTMQMHNRRSRTPSNASTDNLLSNGDALTKNEHVVWGQTPSGNVFQVPTTHDVLTLFHPSYPKSHFDILNLTLLAFQLVLFSYIPRSVSRWFFLLYFAFWRFSYDFGLGWILTKQSKKKWIVRQVRRLGWLDEKRRPAIRNWIKAQLAGKMGQDYSFDGLPLEYNTWLLFRQVVDVILLNDFLSYCMFAFSCFRVPSDLSMFVHTMRWVGGLALIGFNFWVKTQAHNVVKDYGWYWGDCFFRRGALVFDGVFELAPHPMYTVGYAGYYGLSLISGSYPVLFVSLAAHAAQFAFLVLFENPHIERLYGQRKPIAERTPISTSLTREATLVNPSPRSASPSRTNTERSCSECKTFVQRTQASPVLKRMAIARQSLNMSSTESDSCDIAPTPTATEGETETETELDEIEVEQEQKDREKIFNSLPNLLPTGGLGRVRSVSRHDLLNKYFRRDTVLLVGIDVFRTNDLMLLLVLFYAIGFALLPPLSHRGILALHFLHALAWISFHTFGLGLLLRAQSANKFLVRHFLKNYYYPENDGGSGAVQEAFSNWKSLYNISMCMTYTSFVGLVWKTYSIPNEWSVGFELLRHTLGVLLIGLHIWATAESFKALGIFGWFFGDFFMEDFPAHLEYTGIYRYLNNPEVMSGASFFGFALISGSKLVVTLSIIRHLSHWWFLSKVENPHMCKLYGDSLRKEAGFVKVIKTVATKNAKLLESRAGRHAPHIRRVAKEVKVTFDKAIEETAEAVEGFFAKSKPRITEVVEDTKVLIRQSRERLILPRIYKNVLAFDTSKYKITVVKDISSPKESRRFHLGEPITVEWQAPAEHSRRDWIGVYRVGANKMRSITQTSSLGMWVPVHDDEWDGDFPLHLDVPESGKECSGCAVIRGDRLPWQVGQYEIRYHHDGKYNVMNSYGPVEIFVDRPASMDFASVRECLMRIVTLCLDADPSLVPLSSRVNNGTDNASLWESADRGRDPDDFHFWSEQQAKRICKAIKQTFDVEYAPQVIVAHANLSALANRILLSKEILTT